MPDNLNLAPHRGPNVWTEPTVEPAVRTGSAVAGAVMLAAGAATAFFGGRTLYRAIRHGRDTTLGSPVGDNVAGSDRVDEGSAESFPASDPPSWTASDGATLDRHRRE